MSSGQYYRENLIPSNFSSMREEEFDANDLEVAMINSSFEEQLKHTEIFYNPSLKSIFYGSSLTGNEIVKTDHNSTSNTFDQDADMTPLQFLPPITPYSEVGDEDERGKQLDMELERMMLEGDDWKMMKRSPLNSSDGIQSMTYYNISSVSLPSDNAFYVSLGSQIDDQNSDECADAAEAVAKDVIRMVFDDEKNHPTDNEHFSDDEENMVISASILKVLDDEGNLSSGEMDDDQNSEILDSSYTKSNCQVVNHFFSEPTVEMIQNFSSQTSTPDEQTVPVIDNWEELAKKPDKAIEAYNEARAVLRKIRLNKKASQL